MDIITIRGYWESLNKFYLEDTGELIEISPITYLVDEIEKYLPGMAYVNIEINEVEVLINGRDVETQINNTVVSYLFDKELEPNSSH